MLSSSDEDDSVRDSSATVEINGVKIPAKPVRPFTAYHIFFQLERNYILQSNGSFPDLPRDVDDNASERPRKYRGVIMRRNWFIAGSRCKKKRKDHKIHGVISFLDLTRTIAKNWRQADEETKTYCKNLAHYLLQEYRLELEKYSKTYGREALDCQKQKRKRRRQNHNANDSDDNDSDQNPNCDQDADTDASSHEIDQNDRAGAPDINHDSDIEKQGNEIRSNVVMSFPLESSGFAVAAAPNPTAEIGQPAGSIALGVEFFAPDFSPVMRNPVANIEHSLQRNYEPFHQPVQQNAVDQLSDTRNADSSFSVYPLDNEVQEFLTRICRENDLGGLSASGPSSSEEDSSNHSTQLNSNDTQPNTAKSDENVTVSRPRGANSGESKDER